MLDKPDVIVLPEMWNTGYALEQMAELSDKDGQQTKDLLGKFAKENQVNLVAGSVATAKKINF